MLTYRPYVTISYGGKVNTVDVSVGTRFIIAGSKLMCEA